MQKPLLRKHPFLSEVTHLATAIQAAQRMEEMALQAIPIRERKLEACPGAPISLLIQKSAGPAFLQ